MEKRNQAAKLIIGAVIAIIAILFIGGVVFGKPLMYHLQNRDKIGPLTRSDINYVTVDAPQASSNDGTINASDWESVGGMYREIAVTMGQNADNTYIIDYLDQDPYLVNIYEGFGFATEYGSARGHEYTLADVQSTQRPHPLANCLTCKTPNFAKLVNDQGVGVYKMPFADAMALMEENVSCYSCHGNSAGNKGQLEITHSYVVKALDASAIESIGLSTLSCGQCHIEYYFTTSDKETMMPYHDVASMHPDAILAYYNEMDYADFTQENSTGARMLKAQHPEMETFLLGKHAKEGMNCADCHMPMEQSEDGTIYHSHLLVSPLDNETLLSNCLQCHRDLNGFETGAEMIEFVHRLQARVTDRETEVGNELSAFKDALTEAVASGKMSEDELNAVRKVYRNAQWYFDFCYVENAEGAHNSELAFYCLDTSEQLIIEGMALLGK